MLVTKTPKVSFFSPKKVSLLLGENSFSFTLPEKVLLLLGENRFSFSLPEKVLLLLSARSSSRHSCPAQTGAAVPWRYEHQAAAARDVDYQRCALQW